MTLYYNNETTFSVQWLLDSLITLTFLRCLFLIQLKQLCHTLAFRKGGINGETICLRHGTAVILMCFAKLHGIVDEAGGAGSYRPDPVFYFIKFSNLILISSKFVFKSNVRTNKEYPSLCFIVASSKSSFFVFAYRSIPSTL